MSATAVPAVAAVAGPGRPLRILQVTSTAVGGDWFADQVAGLAGRGHRVCAVLPQDGPLAARLRAAGSADVKLIGFGFSRRPRRLRALAAADLALARFIREYRPDVIHAHLIIAALACRAASAAYPAALRVTQMPGMYSLHSPKLRWAERRTLGRDDLVIGSCRAIAEEYQALGARNVAVSYYGCDVTRFNPATAPGPAAFRREFGLTSTTPAVGMIAYMYPAWTQAFDGIGVKGHETFIDAAPLILARLPRARLFIIGDELAGNGDYRRALQARAAARGLDGRLCFTGHRADIPAVLAGLDVLVNPSMSESACYTVVEALLMGKAVVATNVGGLPDTIRHGRTGLLIPPASPAALATAVTSLLADPARRHHLGQAGRQHCLQMFDINTTVTQIEHLYHHSLAALPGKRARR